MESSTCAHLHRTSLHRYRATWSQTQSAAPNACLHGMGLCSFLTLTYHRRACNVHAEQHEQTRVMLTCKGHACIVDAGQYEQTRAMLNCQVQACNVDAEEHGHTQMQCCQCLPAMDMPAMLMLSCMGTNTCNVYLQRISLQC